MAAPKSRPDKEKRSEAHARPEVMTAARVTLRDIGTTLRRLREDRGWTQEKAAESIGVNPLHLLRLEAGKSNVTIATLVAAAVTYGVETHVLLRPQRPARR